MIRRPVRLYPRLSYLGVQPVTTTLKTLLSQADADRAAAQTADDDAAKLHADYLTAATAAASKATDAHTKADASQAKVDRAFTLVAPNGQAVGPFTDTDGSSYMLESGTTGGDPKKVKIVSPDASIDLPDDGGSTDTSTGTGTGTSPAPTAEPTAPPAPNPDGTPKTDAPTS